MRGGKGHNMSGYYEPIKFHGTKAAYERAQAELEGDGKWLTKS